MFVALAWCDPQSIRPAMGQRVALPVVTTVTDCPWWLLGASSDFAVVPRSPTMRDMRWGIAVVSAAVLITSCSDDPGSPHDALDELDDFARLCEDDGVGYSRAAAFTGRGPHPVIAFEDGEDYPNIPFEMDLEPTEVQLVACQRPSGRASDEPIGTCSYRSTGDGDTDFYVDYYQARHRIDIYEARTRRSVGRITLDGPSHAGGDDCPLARALPDGASDGEHMEQDLGPPPEAIQDAVAEFVTSTGGPESSGSPTTQSSG
jgi:hypothetical protein